MTTEQKITRCKRVALGAVWLASMLLTVPAQAGDSQSAGNVTHGARVWVDNCARCHSMRDPKEFRDDQWRVIVNHMRVRGNLTGQDARDARAFLESAN